MGNIPKIKTLIRPCKTYTKMGEVLNPNTNALGHFGMFGQYSNHPNLQILNLFDLKVFLFVDWQVFC